jgi:hypothetical protein
LLFDVLGGGKMSLVVTTYVPEGIVMSSDSRQFITIEGTTPEGKSIRPVETINSDSVYKTFLLTRKVNNEVAFEVGVSTFGNDLLGNISIASHVKRFAEEELTDEDDVVTIATKIVEFFSGQFPDADTGFHVAGFTKEGKVSIPHVYYCHLKNKKIERRNIGPDNNIVYGATWSGQIDVISGILQPLLTQSSDGKTFTMQKAPIVWDAMALQDAVDFSIYAIRTTIDTIRFQARPKNVGGSIDVLVITQEVATWIQRKELIGENTENTRGLNQ